MFNYIQILLHVTIQSWSCFANMDKLNNWVWLNQINKAVYTFLLHSTKGPSTLISCVISCGYSVSCHKSRIDWSCNKVKLLTFHLYVLWVLLLFFIHLVQTTVLRVGLAGKDGFIASFFSALMFRSETLMLICMSLWYIVLLQYVGLKDAVKATTVMLSRWNRHNKM